MLKGGKEVSLVKVVEHFNMAEDSFEFISWREWNCCVVDVYLTLVFRLTLKEEWGRRVYLYEFFKTSNISFFGIHDFFDNICSF